MKDGKLSAASKRALKWPDIGNEWFVEFEGFDLKGDLAYEEGLVRRDGESTLPGWSGSPENNLILV